MADIDGIVAVLDGDRHLTDEEQQEIERIRHEVGNRFCRRCGYCLPCPTEIPIPVALNMLSFIRRFPPETVLGTRFSAVAAKAAGCLQCGVCETRCPYQLPIRDMLIESVAAFGDLQAKHS